MQHIFCTLFPVLIYFRKSNSIELLDDEKNSAVVRGSECLIDLIGKHFEIGSNIALVRSGLQNYTTNKIGKYEPDVMLDFLMKNPMWTIMVKLKYGYQMSKHVKSVSTKERVDHYIIYSRFQSDIRVVIDFLAVTESWNPHAKFVIYINQIYEDFVEFASFIYTEFWNHLVINVIVMVPIQSDNFDQTIVTWYPYDTKNCAGRNLEITKLAHCRNGRLDPPTIDVFPNKIPSNWKRCPFIVATNIWPPFVIDSRTNSSRQMAHIHNAIVKLTEGIEVEIINALANSMNFQASFIVHNTHRLGEIYGNGSSTGMLGDLLKRRAQLAVGRVTPNEILHRKFDHTVQYTKDEITWIVPATRKIFFSWKIFQTSVIVATAIAFCLAGGLMYAMGHSVVIEKPFYKNFLDIYLLTWGMMIMVPLPTLPKSGRIKIFLSLWALFCLHWYSAYNSSLYSNLTQIKLANKINTFADILSKGLKFGMLDPNTRYFRTEHADAVSEYILNNYITCTNIDDCLDRVAYQKDFAMAFSRPYFDYVIKDYQDPDSGEPLMKAFKSNIITLPVEMITIKGQPMLQSINKKLLQMTESGLIDFWSRKIMRKRIIGKRRHEHHPLRLAQVSYAVYVLFWGLIISIFAFLGELLHFHWYLNKFNKVSSFANHLNVNIVSS